MRFYDAINYLNINDLLRDSNTGSVEAPIVQEINTIHLNIDGQAFQINNNLIALNKLNNIAENKPSANRRGKNKSEISTIGALGGSFRYDLKVAEEYLLSPEDSKYRMLEIEDTSDAWVSARTTIEPEAPEITREEARWKFCFLYAVANIISNEIYLTDIISLFPKNEDGTFIKNQLFRIGAVPVVYTNTLIYGKYEIYEVIATAESDYTLTLGVRSLGISSDELEAVYRDYVSTHWEKLGLGKYMNLKIPRVLPDEDDNFEIKGNCLLIKDPHLDRLYLAMLGVLDSVIIDGNEIIICFPHKENYFVPIRDVDTLINIDEVIFSITKAWNLLLVQKGFHNKNRKCSLRTSVLEFAKSVDDLNEFIERIPRLAKRAKDGTLSISQSIDLYRENPLRKSRFLELNSAYMDRKKVSNEEIKITFRI